MNHPTELKDTVSVVVFGYKVFAFIRHSSFNTSLNSSDGPTMDLLELEPGIVARILELADDLDVIPNVAAVSKSYHKLVKDVRPHVVAGANVRLSRFLRSLETQGKGYESTRPRREECNVRALDLVGGPDDALSWSCVQSDGRDIGPSKHFRAVTFTRSRAW